MKSHHSPRRSEFFALLPAATGFALLVSGNAVQGAVTVNSSVNFLNGIYTYSFTVTNFGTTFDLALVNIPVGPGVSVNNFVAPTGFNLIFDASPVNLVTFLEDSDPGTSQTFAPDSTSGTFSFQSLLGPSSVAFSALDVNGDPYIGFTQSAVPEPSTLLLIGTAAVPFLISRRRRIVG